jgi:hypothetical protein
MVTILTDSGTAEIDNARAAGDALWISRADVEAAIGWTLKPEGLCQGSVCIPTPRHDADAFTTGEEVNVAAWWQLMGRPVLHDNAGATWMLGASAAERGEVLKTLTAPDFTLPDLDGNLHSLADYRGKRVFLTTWSSW